jgi:dienelactone hydrolase
MAPGTFRLTVVVALLTGCPARAQESLNVLPADAAPRRLLRAYLLAEAHKHFDARRKEVAALKTPEAIRARQERLRAKFLAALGGLPERTPLHPRVVGTRKCARYTIEKVIYESRPDHHVTATFYLPEGKPPFPGVLMPIGHSDTGKAADYVQRGAILLAKNGIAVLAYDPIGQGERRQGLVAGKFVVPGNTIEHTLAGVGALLVGTNTATYRIWDGMRSLDYLAGRPEVDAKRLGCSGCSGGGTLTSYLMALDERIVAAAPSCYVTSLERLFATIGPQDAEQNITGQVAFGLEHADYLTLRAPRPTLVLAATRDFFDIGGTWTSFREAKRLYGLLGHGERVDIFESDSGHGYPRAQRQAMLRWMRRWLLNKDDAPVEEDFPILKEAELRCTRTGQVLEDFKGVSVFTLNARRAAELAERRPRVQADLGKEGLVREVSRLAGVRLPVAAAKMREASTLERPGYAIRKLAFTTEPGITVPGLLFGKEGSGPLVVYLHGAGKAAEAGPGVAVERLVKAGRRVLALDLRGLGETAPAGRSGRWDSFFGADFTEAYLALHLNRPLLGQRVQDVLSVLAQLAESTPAGFDLVGVGSAGPVALHAAFLDARVKRLTLEGALVSWSAVVRTPGSINQLTNVVPGALAVYDLPDLAAGLAPRPLTIEAPADPAGRPLSAEGVKEAYAAVRSAYARHKAEKDLVLAAGKAKPER